MNLKFEGRELGLIAGYLHDTGFTWSDVVFDVNSKTLTILFNRPFHESPQHTRFLGIVPIVRFKTVPARLIIRNVADMSSTTRHEHAEKPTYTHSLIDLTLDGDELTVESDGATIRAKLDGLVPMELRDAGQPSARPHIVDLFSAVSRFEKMLNEIHRMQSDA